MPESHSMGNEKNIILIGMPGSGKTTIGREMARMLDRPFLDADEGIEIACGMGISEIFRQFGEAHFRDVEQKWIEEHAALRGFVIATGGGAILRDVNMQALRKGGQIIHIIRNNALLSMNGRPLSLTRQALYAMEKERMPLYRHHSDAEIHNDATIKDAARAAIFLLNADMDKDEEDDTR